MKKFLILIIALFPIVGCSVSRFASVNKNSSFDGYKYVYVVGTNDLSSSAGYASGSQNWLYGASTSKSVNPSDVIAGYLMKKGPVFPIVKEAKEGWDMMVRLAREGTK